MVGSASAGLALTQGNSDTSTVNAAYELKRDTGGDIVRRALEDGRLRRRALHARRRHRGQHYRRLADEVEFLDTYKARPPLPGIKKNVIAVLVSFVYKFD